MDEEHGLETLVRKIREISHRFLGKVLFLLDLVPFASCSFSYHVNSPFTFPRTINSYEKLFKQQKWDS